MNTLARKIAYHLDPALWMREIAGIPPRPWQEQFLRVHRGASVLILTARQVGKTTAAATAMAHTAVFKPGSLSVAACPAQRQSAELLRKARGTIIKADAKLVSDNVYGLELENGARVLALPGNEDSIRGLTVDGWIVVDEAGYVDDEMIAALRPMKAQRPDARFVMLSTANSRTDPFWSAWESGGQSWTRIQVTVDKDPSLYSTAHLTEERLVLGEDRFKREYLGIPAGGLVSPFKWDYFDHAVKAPLIEGTWNMLKPTIIVHDVGCTKDRSTAVVGGRTPLATGMTMLERFIELPQGLIGRNRAEALAAVDRLYGHRTLIFVDTSYDPTYVEVLAERLGPERIIGIKITNSTDVGEGPPEVGNNRIRVYKVGRSPLFDLLWRELNDGKVRILDGAESRRAYEQLTRLEMDYRPNGAIYSCASNRHDDLAISAAIANWALRHPHLEYWMRALEPRKVIGPGHIYI